MKMSFRVEENNTNNVDVVVCIEERPWSPSAADHRHQWPARASLSSSSRQKFQE